jgi:hypothetical protein
MSQLQTHKQKPVSYYVRKKGLCHKCFSSNVEGVVIGENVSEKFIDKRARAYLGAFLCDSCFDEFGSIT